MGKVKEFFFSVEDSSYLNTTISIKDAMFLSREGRLNGMPHDDGYRFEENETEEDDYYVKVV